MQQSSAAQAVKLNEVRLRDEVAEYSKVKKKELQRKDKKSNPMPSMRRYFFF